MSDEPWEPPETIVVPITDVLDLHWFRPSEIGSLIPEYLTEALAAGFTRVRIVHGKGTGALRKGVHKVLERDPRVVRFELAGGRGGWGATVAWLREG
jgi:dsDNA-specific endonuclease/ATPase MutS2